MKAITCLIGLFLLFLASPAKAQSDGDEIPWSINSGTMVGIGSYNLMDTYLSPSMEDKKYTGPGLRVMNERMKRVRLANYRVSRQQIISVDRLARIMLPLPLRISRALSIIRWVTIIICPRYCRI